MMTFLEEKLDTSEALEFLYLAEVGEIAHSELLQAIVQALIIKR